MSEEAICVDLSKDIEDLGMRQNYYHNNLVKICANEGDFKKMKGKAILAILPLEVA